MREDLQFTVSDLGLIEIPAGSHPSEDAQRVGKYARAQLAALEAEPAVWFQFRDINAPAPSGVVSVSCRLTVASLVGVPDQRRGRAYADANEHRIGGASGVKRMGSGLLKHQTDIDYGEWSAGLLVITANPKDFKAGAKALDIRTWGRVASVTSYGKLSRRGSSTR